MPDPLPIMACNAVDVGRMPVQVFETERLVVRRVRPDDLDDVAAPTGDPAIVRSMDEGRPLSRERNHAWIEVSATNYRTRDYGRFTVTAKPEDRVIGACGFAFPPARPGIVEVIDAFAPSCWGRGGATAAVRATVAFGFEECGLTQARCDGGLRQRGVEAGAGEKVGLAHEGRGEHDDGSSTDSYAIARGDALR